jgi:hypothetical protein
VGVVVFLGLAIASVAWVLDEQQKRDAAQDRRARAENVREAVDLAAVFARRDCEAANERSELFRTIGARLAVVAVEASNESLIIVVNQVGDEPVPPETADLLRSVGVAQAEQRANAAVAELADRDCDAEERRARADAEAAFSSG